jgi:hypothetical protein
VPSFHRHRLILIAAQVLFAWVSSARGQLVEQIDEVMGKVLNHEEFQGVEKVIVGGFQCAKPQQDLHADSAIKHNIVESLKRRNVTIEKRGPFPAISGQYDYATTEGLEIDIDLYLSGRGGDQLATFPVRVDFGKDNHQVLNISAPSSVKLSTKATGYERGEEVTTALEKPQVTVHKASASAPGGQFEVLVLCETGGKFTPAEVHDDGGFAYVQMKMGQAYRILVKNNSSHEAVALVTVDGLDVFTFADKKSPGYLVPAGGKHEIKGWFVSNKSANSFVVGKFAETPAAELLGEAADTGVICVQFAAAWTPGNRPADEGGTLSGSAAGTKRGPPVDQNVSRVPREIGKVREVVSIRYGVNPPG